MSNEEKAFVRAELELIGEQIGYGEAQRVLGELWDAKHGCAPRGSMGVTVKPIDMVLYCPACGLQHIDAPSGRVLYGDEPIDDQSHTPTWNNPPHRSHLCHGCGHIWRPADVPTNGVKATKTRGRADSTALDLAEAKHDWTKRP